MCSYNLLFLSPRDRHRKEAARCCPEVIPDRHPIGKK
jgi:hypothetical protein